MKNTCQALALHEVKTDRQTNRMKGRQADTHTEQGIFKAVVTHFAAGVQRIHPPLRVEMQGQARAEAAW